MKLGQLSDKKVDQNEIESEYIWNLPEKESKMIQRINLSKLAIDFSQKLKTTAFFRSCISLPNNQIFGIKVCPPDLHSGQLFISDEKFNLKAIGPTLNKDYSYQCPVACFYDDSIFIFECYFNSSRKRVTAKRYIISQNKWINLNIICSNVTFCIGFNQKIIIVATYVQEIIIYDIYLDSYDDHYIKEEFRFRDEKIMLKSQGKLYLISHLPGQYDEIYLTDNPLSKWTFVSRIECFKWWTFGFRFAWHKKTFFYIRESALYQFNLRNFQSKSFYNLKNIQLNKKALKK